MGLQVVSCLAMAVCLFALTGLSRGGEWPESCGKAKSHHSYYGGRGYNDRILYVNQTVVQGSMLRKQSFDVELPPKGVPRQGLISYVEALDQYKNGDGGCAYLKSGGPGYPYVVLHLKSQRGEGVNFIINVYGN